VRTKTRRYYPAMLALDGRDAVVVGGGSIAARKIAELAACGAIVTVIDPHPGTAVETLAAAGRVTLVRRCYSASDLAGAAIAIVATDESAVQEAAWQEARAANIPVNTVDDARRCSFIAPSILRRGDLTIAVSTSGTIPGLARRIRERLEAAFPQTFGAFLELAAAARGRLRSAGVSYAMRDRFAGDVFSSPALALLEAGDREGARALVDACAARYERAR